MKKKIIIAISLIILMLFTRVKATCEFEEFNEMAEKFKVVYTEDTVPKIVSESGKVTELKKEYAYFLVFSPVTEMLKIEVTNSLDKKVQIAEYNNTQKAYVIGSYIHNEPKEYTIKVYGTNKSLCSGELLKTTKITVPGFNEYSLFEYCVENETEDICSMMKDTSKVSLEEFKEIASKTEKQKKIENMTALEKVKYYALRYGLFILIPILAISIYYVVKMREYKKKVRNQ